MAEKNSDIIIILSTLIDRSTHLLLFSCLCLLGLPRSNLLSLRISIRSKKNRAGMAQQFGEIVWENDVHKVEPRCVDQIVWETSYSVAE